MLHQCIIRYKDKVWLGHNTEAHKAIMLSLYASGVGGHSGFQGTYQRIKARFAWPVMKRDIQSYVKECTVCQQAEHIKKPGLLSPLPVPKEAWNLVTMDFIGGSPLPVPKEAWNLVTMDFIGGLPKRKNFDTILVVIDKFSKYGHFLPLALPLTALQVA